MRKVLDDAQYDFLANEDKDFTAAFDCAMADTGFECGGVQPYVCLGRYKIEYGVAGLKNKKIVARIYFRDSGIVLRLYFTGIDKHREYIEAAPDFIKQPFINEHGKCRQCDKSGGGIGKKGKCSFKKAYTVNGVFYEKCAGESFYFPTHSADNIPKYIELLREFYPAKKHG